MLSRIVRRLSRETVPNRPARPLRLECEQLESREVPAIVYGLLQGNALIRFDSANPTATTSVGVVSGLIAGQTLVGIDFRPRTGQLIGSAVTTGSAANSPISTYVINPTTGVATLIGTAPALPGAGDIPSGYDFNPTVDRIRYVNINDENARLNPVNGGLAGDDTNLTPPTVDAIGAAYDRNFDRQTGASTTIPTTLYLIDRAGNQLVLLGGVNGTPSPNGGVTIPRGPLGITLAAGADGGFDISVDPSVSFALNNNGLGRALAALTTSDGITRLYDINLATGTATVIGTIGNGAMQLRSIAILPSSAVTVATGVGGSGTAQLLGPSGSGIVRQSVQPFTGFQGAIRTAAGDINGDGYADTIVSAVAPQGHIQVFSGVDGSLLASFLAFSGFQGTVNVGSGDVNGDGYDDILVVANNANGHVKAFSGLDGSILSSFLSYPGFLGTVNIAGADIDADGRAEILTLAAFNGHVKTFTSSGALFTTTLPQLAGFRNSFLAFPGFTGEIRIAGGDVNRDGFADIVYASGPGTRGHVQAFSSTDGSLLASFFAFEGGFIGGASVALADANLDGNLDIAVTPGPGRPTTVSFFDVFSGPIGSIPIFPGFSGGASVGGTRG